jgi:LmbE family N-acetylglucosaminyl deacetylase
MPVHKKNVLAIGAHPDDIEFGCSGTLKRHINDGDEVTMVVMTSSDVFDAYTLEVTRDSILSENEAKCSAQKIGANLIIGPFSDTKIPFNGESVSFLERIIKQNNINIVYTHWGGDTHQDHINTLSATMAAGRLIKNIFCYEQVPLPRITTIYPVANYYVDITQTFNDKLDACKCHISQIDKFKQQGFNMIENLTTLAAYRGTQAGVKYAEAFNVLKIVR